MRTRSALEAAYQRSAPASSPERSATWTAASSVSAPARCPRVFRAVATASARCSRAAGDGVAHVARAGERPGGDHLRVRVGAREHAERGGGVEAPREQRTAKRRARRERAVHPAEPELVQRGVLDVALQADHEREAPL